MNNQQKEVTATLCAHSGAEKVTRQQLAMVPTPAATHSHTPIPHIELVERLEKVLISKKLRIESEEYAVQSDGGMKLFGTLKLAYEVTVNRPTIQGYRFALGIRTANDKSLAVQMIAGANVFVCDNMAFHGSAIVCSRKHTAHIDIQAELEGGVTKALAQFAVIRQSIDSLQIGTIDDNSAKAIILDAAIKGVMPLRLIPHVHKAYFTPLHQEFEPRTMWSLHNAFTESFKLLVPGVAMQSGIELGEMFGM
jgi:hypothetical protein